MHYIFLHWTWWTPTNFRFPRLRDFLEEQGHQVSTPTLPYPERPERKLWTEFLFKEYTFTSETVVIGHSAGATCILSLIDQLESPIHKAILVAGYAVPLPHIQRTKHMIQDSYDRERMKNNAKEIVFINSDNDPYECHDRQVRSLVERLDATFVFAKWMWHMWSGTYNDRCKELPLLLPYL